MLSRLLPLGDDAALVWIPKIGCSRVRIRIGVLLIPSAPPCFSICWARSAKAGNAMHEC